MTPLYSDGLGSHMTSTKSCKDIGRSLAFPPDSMVYEHKMHAFIYTRTPWSLPFELDREVSKEVL